MKMVVCHEIFSFVHLGVKYRCRNRQSLRGIIHGCFQVCKHLISCILQCARRDHLGHICCKLKHFKFEATLCRNRLQQEGRTCLQWQTFNLTWMCSIYQQIPRLLSHLDYGWLWTTSLWASVQVTVSRNYIKGILLKRWLKWKQHLFIFKYINVKQTHLRTKLLA